MTHPLLGERHGDIVECTLDCEGMAKPLWAGSSAGDICISHNKFNASPSRGSRELPQKLIRVFAAMRSQGEGVAPWQREFSDVIVGSLLPIQLRHTIRTPEHCVRCFCLPVVV